jgi:hypothetical protein
MANALVRINWDKRIRKEQIEDFPVFRVTSPTGTDNFSIGDIVTVVWDTPLPNNFSIKIMKSEFESEIYVHEVTTFVSGNFISFTFEIPRIGDQIANHLMDGGEYFIEMEDLTTNEIYTSTNFSIGGYNGYYSLEGGDVLGYQWEDRIISISELDETSGDDKEYQTSMVTLKLKDLDDKIKTRLQTEKTDKPYGTEAEIYDAAGNSLRILFVTDWTISKDDVTLFLSDRFGSFENTPIWDKTITENEFPNANTSNFGTFINFVVGDFPRPALVGDYGKGTIKAPNVDVPAGKYLVGKLPFAMLPLTPFSVFDSNDVDITATSVLSVGADGYTYITHVVGVFDFVKVYVFVNNPPTTKITSEDQLKAIMGLYSNEFERPLLTSYFISRQYDVSLQAKWNYIINNNITGKTLLKELAVILGLDYYINESNKIVFTSLDYNALQTSKTFQEAEILSYTPQKVDPTKLLNRVNFQTDYDAFSNNYLKSRTVNNYNSQDDWGVVHAVDRTYKNTQYTGSVIGDTTAKQELMTKIDVLTKVDVKFNYDDVSDLKMFNLIEFPSQFAVTSTDRLYRIKGFSRDFPSGFVTLTLEDIEHYRNIDAAQRFLINSNDVTGSTFIKDMSIEGFFEISNFGVTHDETIKKLGSSSLKFDGSSHFTAGIDGDSYIRENFDFMNQTEFNVEGYVRFSALGSSEYIYHQYKDANNNIRIRKTGTNTLNFRVRIGGVNVLGLNSTSTFSAGTWAHFNIVRVANGDMGLYIDHVQEAYVNYPTTHFPFQVHIEVGRFNDGVTPGSYFTGNMDGFQINHDNKYSLAPVVGLTNYFTPSKKQQGFEKIERLIEMQFPLNLPIGQSESYNIEWDTENIANNLKIELYDQSDVLDSVISAGLNANLGTFAYFFAPIGGQGTYKVRISELNTSYFVESPFFVIGEHDTRFLLHADQNAANYMKDSALIPTPSIIVNNVVDTTNYVIHETDVNNKIKFNDTALSFRSTPNVPHLSVASATEFSMPPVSQKVTIDFWMNFDTSEIGNINSMIASYLDANNVWNIRKHSDETIIFFLIDSSSLILSLTSSSAIEDNMWYHIAVVRDTADWGLYINGIQEAHATTAVSTWPFTGTGLVGAYTGGGLSFVGSMTEPRISDDNPFNVIPNVGLTSTFIPPLETYKPLNGVGTDSALTYDTDTKLLIHSNELNTGHLTDIIDSSLIGALKINNPNGVAHSITQKKWNATSLEFLKASSRHLVLGTDSKYDVSNKATLTMDFWIYPDSGETGLQNMIFHRYLDASNFIELKKLTTDEFNFTLRFGGSTVINMSAGASNFTFDTWQHVCLIRDGSGNWGLYVDGTQFTYVSYAPTHTITAQSWIGGNINLASEYVEGFIDEFRLSNGNPFGAAPVVGLTDTITVPVQIYDPVNSTGA